jgi:hypothetical protein
MKPILLDFSDSFETERLTIRSLMPGDGAQGDKLRDMLISVCPEPPEAK